jgi:SAM-dependent methyltransferase
VTYVAELEAWPEAILSGPGDACLRVVDTDESIHLPVQRWHGPVPGEEARLLDLVVSPVLDIGCGPGRHTAALIRAGHSALGIDTSASAVRAARRRGGPATCASVFGAVPRAGTWSTALLLDGNIGIGGDPVGLLRRVHELLRPA